MNADDSISQRSDGDHLTGSCVTCFAPARRADPERLADDIRAVSNNPVIDVLMGTVGGLIAVLNEQRQVLALNNSMLEALGVTEPAEVLGLRVGEAVQCVHAHDMPGGCGTSESCATCGAAIAQVTALREGAPAERLCAITARRNSGEIHLYLNVRVAPFVFDSKCVLLLFMQDVTHQQQLAALERVFFHDLRNALTGLLGSNELLQRKLERSGSIAELAGDAARLARRVTREVELQRCLTQSSMHTYEPASESWTTDAIFRELKAMCEHHPAAEGRRIEFGQGSSDTAIKTDSTVLLRVLFNMVINALEATPVGSGIRIWVEALDGSAEFCVWNPAVIPPALALRVFQRNFSTKGMFGRGLGTYSMKLLGEQLLGGRVFFSSIEHEGTCFRIRLPV